MEIKAEPRQQFSENFANQILQWTNAEERKINDSVVKEARIVEAKINALKKSIEKIAQSEENISTAILKVASLSHRFIYVEEDQNIKDLLIERSIKQLCDKLKESKRGNDSDVIMEVIRNIPDKKIQANCLIGFLKSRFNTNREGYGTENNISSPAERTKLFLFAVELGIEIVESSDIHYGYYDKVIESTSKACAIYDGRKSKRAGDPESILDLDLDALLVAINTEDHGKKEKMINGLLLAIHRSKNNPHRYLQINSKEAIDAIREQIGDVNLIKLIRSKMGYIEEYGRDILLSYLKKEIYRERVVNRKEQGREGEKVEEKESENVVREEIPLSEAIHRINQQNQPFDQKFTYLIAYRLSSSFYGIEACLENPDFLNLLKNLTQDQIVFILENSGWGKAINKQGQLVTMPMKQIVNKVAIANLLNIVSNLPPQAQNQIINQCSSYINSDALNKIYPSEATRDIIRRIQDTKIARMASYDDRRNEPVRIESTQDLIERIKISDGRYDWLKDLPFDTKTEILRACGKEWNPVDRGVFNVRNIIALTTSLLGDAIKDGVINEGNSAFIMRDIALALRISEVAQQAVVELIEKLNPQSKGFLLTAYQAIKENPPHSDSYIITTKRNALLESLGGAQALETNAQQENKNYNSEEQYEGDKGEEDDQNEEFKVPNETTEHETNFEGTYADLSNRQNANNDRNPLETLFQRRRDLVIPVLAFQDEENQPGAKSEAEEKNEIQNKEQIVIAPSEQKKNLETLKLESKSIENKSEDQIIVQFICDVASSDITDKEKDKLILRIVEKLPTDKKASVIKFCKNIEDTNLRSQAIDLILGQKLCELHKEPNQARKIILAALVATDGLDSKGNPIHAYLRDGVKYKYDEYGKRKDVGDTLEKQIKRIENHNEYFTQAMGLRVGSDRRSIMTYELFNSLKEVTEEERAAIISGFLKIPRMSDNNKLYEKYPLHNYYSGNHPDHGKNTDNSNKRREHTYSDAGFNFRQLFLQYENPILRRLLLDDEISIKDRAKILHSLVDQEIKDGPTYTDVSYNSYYRGDTVETTENTFDILIAYSSLKKQDISSTLIQLIDSLDISLMMKEEVLIQKIPQLVEAADKIDPNIADSLLKRLSEKNQEINGKSKEVCDANVAAINAIGIQLQENRRRKRIPSASPDPSYAGQAVETKEREQ